jgi:hypothetical protein
VVDLNCHWKLKEPMLIVSVEWSDQERGPEMVLEMEELLKLE